MIFVSNLHCFYHTENFIKISAKFLWIIKNCSCDSFIINNKYRTNSIFAFPRMNHAQSTSHITVILQTADELAASKKGA